MHPPSIIGLLVAFAVLAALFGVIEGRFGAIRGAGIWRRERLCDFAYWLFTPLITNPLAIGGLALILGIVAALAGHPHDFKGFAEALQAQSPIALQPRWLQGIEALLLADLVGYWVHRLFHRRPLWRFHAIHHSAQALDWLAATRLHPVNDMLNRALTVLPLFFLGFRLDVLASVTPLLTFWAIFIHANLDWDLGPLRLVVTSPRFHRWHHTSEAEGLDRNFAGLFPFIDVVFGTCHMPRDRAPRQFGLSNETVPAGLLGQLAYPFAGRPRVP